MALYAFDGTWNLRDSKDPLNEPSPSQYGDDVAPGRDTSETNVYRFMEFYGKSKSYYIEGIGTRFGAVGRVMGGVFGAGGKSRIREMYFELMKRYHAAEPDTEIDIIGFSRGAALAVHFANVVDRIGVRDPSGKRFRLPRYYRDLGWVSRFPKRTANEVGTSIDFLGLWDTVATFGIPIGRLRNRSSVWHLKVPDNVVRCFHAMALDEVRATFELVDIVNERHPRIYQVWFRGVHANVGGGYVDRGLSDIALAWMMEQAVWAWRKLDRQPAAPPRFLEALKMLEGDPGDPPNWSQTNLEYLTPDPNGYLGRPKDLRRQDARPLGKEPVAHHSVLLRDHNLLSDHRGAGRRLLRRIPKNVSIVYDPPVFYADSRVEFLGELVLSTFVRVSTNPRDWLMIDGQYVFRSDHWIGYGPRESRTVRELRVGKVPKDVFLAVARSWFAAGRPSNPSELDSEIPKWEVHPKDPDQTHDEIRAWLVKVLGEMEPYLPFEQASHWPRSS
ncbi:MAG: DUF2235 domain-containing protein [bacterium]|nr:DUF2235 domain-containing protein [bacterium]